MNILNAFKMQILTVTAAVTLPSQNIKINELMSFIKVFLLPIFYNMIHKDLVALQTFITYRLIPVRTRFYALFTLLKITQCIF